MRNGDSRRDTKSLPYLTEATASHTLFVLSKEHYEGFNARAGGLHQRALAGQ